MSVLITGYGRSGTAFLSKVFSLSNEWKSIHEYKYDKLYDKKTISIVNRFRRDKYVEVNSYLRCIANDIEANTRFIVRNPTDILKSGIQRCKDNNQIEKLINDIPIGLKALDKIECEPISFSKMTSDIEYLENIIKWVGIQDINIDDISLNKVNINKVNNKTIDSNKILQFQKTVEWYTSKYINYM